MPTARGPLQVYGQPARTTLGSGTLPHSRAVFPSPPRPATLAVLIPTPRATVSAGPAPARGGPSGCAHPVGTRTPPAPVPLPLKPGTHGTSTCRSHGAQSRGPPELHSDPLTGTGIQVVSQHVHATVGLTQAAASARLTGPPPHSVAVSASASLGTGSERQYHHHRGHCVCGTTHWHHRDHPPPGARHCGHHHQAQWHHSHCIWPA